MRNEYVVEGNVVKIFFKSGEYFICDLDMFPEISKHSWYKSKNGYAVTTINYKKVYAHVLVFGAKSGYEIDHTNRNKLDDRYCNLRYVTHHGNAINQDFTVFQKNNPATGIEFRKDKYNAYIHYKGKKKHLGSFKTLAEAQESRKQAEDFYWGKQA